MKTQKPRIAIVAGGYSGEREVSLRSAATIIKNIDTTLFSPYLVRLSKELWEVQVEETWLPIDLNHFSFILGGNESVIETALFTSKDKGEVVAVYGEPCSLYLYLP